MELEQGKNVDFWRDMTTITEDEISKLRKLEASGRGPGTSLFPLNANCMCNVMLCSARFLVPLSSLPSFKILR